MTYRVYYGGKDYSLSHVGDVTNYKGIAPAIREIKGVSRLTIRSRERYDSDDYAYSEVWELGDGSTVDIDALA
jgi:hypothetical protein